ncbi:MAG: helix-turn-helix domain-containing protein [Lachnospiraceae bacterium]|jgi:transcriptional regulator with XRE-family HTH domain|nr:helix-turn-helix domain-containing protein [Lachnospiraceae bacterium]
MNYNNIADNVKRLREARRMTQEQLANELGVTFQAVSKWENGVTMPDVMMMPQIAQVFGITIDELYKPAAEVYKNEAERWLSKYTASHNQDDFFRADVEFRRLLDSGDYTDEDMIAYGTLYRFHADYCKKKAFELYDFVLAKNKAESYEAAWSNKGALMAAVGQGEDYVVHFENEAVNDPSLANYRLLMRACFWTQKYEKGLECYEEILKRFPNLEKEELRVLHSTAGDMCRGLKKYEEAFGYWEKALLADAWPMDPMFSIACCLSEMGEYAKAADAWKRIVDELIARGFTYEVEWPRQMMNEAKAKS